MLSSLIRRLHIEERAQDTFEYLLIVGVLVVGVIAAAVAFPGLISTVIALVTTAINGLFV